MWPGHAADHSLPSRCMVMEEYSCTSTHPLGHMGPVTGSLYLFTVLNCYYSSVFVYSTLLKPPMPPLAWFGVLQLEKGQMKGVCSICDYRTRNYINIILFIRIKWPWTQYRNVPKNEGNTNTKGWNG